MDNNQVKKDIQEIINNSDFLKFFNNKTLLITGGTGLIGSTIVKTLLTFNVQNNCNIKIIAHVRNRIKAQKKFISFKNDQNLIILVGNITDPIVFDGYVDYVIHCASSTASIDFVNKPIETITTTISGTRNILEFSRIKGVCSFIFLSSLEVYGVMDSVSVKENDAGPLDWINVRSSYSESKRMAECLCMSYLSEFKLPVIIVRLAQTFGAGIDNSDNRVYAQFAKAAAYGKEIVLKTKGDTVRNYCYLTDVIRALLFLLQKGDKGEVYNIANEDTACSIFDMAKTVSRLSNNSGCVVKFDLSNDIHKLGYNPKTRICLSSKKIRELGWKPLVTLDDAFLRLISSLKNT